MKLIKIEHDEQGIWYFSNKSKAAKYIGTSGIYIDYGLKTGKKCKGWTIEEIESDDILSRYINPEK